MANPKISRRAAQRLARQIAEEQTQIPDLPDDLDEMLMAYRVSGVDDAVWSQVQPVLHDVMRRSHIRGAASFRKHLGVVAKYLVYREQNSSSLDVELAFSATQIDHYYLHGLANSSHRTRNDYRSRLNKIAEHVATGPNAPVKAPPLGHRSVRPGYNTVEESQIKRVALRQHNDGCRRQLSALVGLTMGAGLGPADLRDLRVHDIRDHDDDGIEIHVRGKLARTVWVRRDYEMFVRTGIQGLDPGELVIGEKVDRRNITTGIIQRADRYDGPKLDASRMRSTWLTWLMRRHVPIQVIMQASGLQTARTLTELAALMDDPDDDTGPMLRGAD